VSAPGCKVEEESAEGSAVIEIGPFVVSASNGVPTPDVLLAGLASTVYLITKSIFQIPVARVIDKKKGERDDFWFMIVGSLLITLSAFMSAMKVLHSSEVRS